MSSCSSNSNSPNSSINSNRKIKHSQALLKSKKILIVNQEVNQQKLALVLEKVVAKVDKGGIMEEVVNKQNKQMKQNKQISGNCLNIKQLGSNLDLDKDTHIDKEEEVKQIEKPEESNKSVKTETSKKLKGKNNKESKENESIKSIKSINTKSVLSVKKEETCKDFKSINNSFHQDQDLDEEFKQRQEKIKADFLKEEERLRMEYESKKLEIEKAQIKNN